MVECPHINAVYPVFCGPLTKPDCDCGTWVQLPEKRHVLYWECKDCGQQACCLEDFV